MFLVWENRFIFFSFRVPFISLNDLKMRRKCSMTASLESPSLGWYRRRYAPINECATSNGYLSIYLFIYLFIYLIVVIE